MHVLIVLAHPEPKSFNAQLAACAVKTLTQNGHSVEVSDLYAQGFDPSERQSHYCELANPDWFDVQAEQRHAHSSGTLAADVAAEWNKINRAELVIFQFPMWWFTFPAMMKGWFDRVLSYGQAYTGSIRYDRGHFRGRRAMLSVTFGGPESTFKYNGRNGDVDLLLWPMNMCLNFVGYTVLEPFTAFGVEGGLKYSDDEANLRRLASHKQRFERRLSIINTVPAVPFNGWNDWDADGRLKPGVTGYSQFMREMP